MAGKAIKYRKYSGQGSGVITIPNSIAQALDWSFNEEIDLTIEFIKGRKGIFLSNGKEGND